MGLEDVGVNLIARGEAAFINAMNKAHGSIVKVGTASDNTQGPMGRMSLATLALANALGQALYNAAVSAGRAIIGFAGDSIKAASDLNETANKINVLFGEEGAGSINKFAESAAESLGQSQQSALDAAATFGVFGKSAGLAGEDLVGFSTEMVGLSSDLASFYNTSPEDAITAIGAALRGESEPIRKYGILLDDASLRQQALEMGIIKTTKKALTPQQRVLAAQALILKQSSDAQGDFARTSTGLANSQRIVTAQLDNVKASLGKGLLPLVELGTQMLSKNVMPALMRFIDEFVGPAIEGITKFGSKFLDVINVIFGVVSGEGVDANLLSKILGEGVSIEDLAAGMKDLPSKLISYLFGEGAAGEISNFLDFFQPLIDSFSNLFGAIMENAPMVQQTISDMFTFVLTTISTFGPGIVAQVATILDQIAIFWTAHGEEIMGIVQFLWNFIVTTVTVILTLVSGIISSIMMIINGNWEGAWLNIQTTFTNVMNIILALVGTNLTQFISIWDSNLKMAGDILKALFDRAYLILSEAVNQFFSYGAQIFEGLRAGMESRVNDVIAWLQQAWEKIKDLWGKITGIHSPSKVFAGYGKMLMLGLEKGIIESAIGPARATSAALQMSAMPSSSVSNYNTTNSYYYNLGIKTSQSPSTVQRSFAMMQMIGR